MTVDTKVLTCAAQLSTDSAAGRLYLDDLPGLEPFRCPSVTSVLGYLDSGGKGLHLWWAAAAVTSAAADIGTLASDLAAVDGWIRKHKMAGFAALKEAGERGSKVHDAAQRLLLGQPHGLNDVWDGAAYQYLPALEAFLADHRPTPVAVEVPVFSREHGFAGRFDAICRLQSMPNRLVILDFKTRSSAAACAEARPSEPVQLAAYQRAEYMVVDGADGLERVPMPQVDAAVIVALAPDGTYTVLEVPTDEAVFGVFLGALNAAPYFRLRKDSKGTPVPAATVTEALELSLEAADLPVPPEDPFVTFGAAPVKVDTVMVDWLRARAKWLHAQNPDAFDRLAATWPDGTPGLYGAPLPGPEHIGVICHHFGQVEADFAVPFFDQSDPRAKAVCKVRPALGSLPAKPARTPAPPPAATPTDGTSDAGLLAWILDRWGELPSDARKDIETVAQVAGICNLRHGATRDQLEQVRLWVIDAETQVSDLIATTLGFAAHRGLTRDTVQLLVLKATDGRTGDVDLLTAAEHAALRLLIPKTAPATGTETQPTTEKDPTHA